MFTRSLFALLVMLSFTNSHSMLSKLNFCSKGQIKAWQNLQNFYEEQYRDVIKPQATAALEISLRRPGSHAKQLNEVGALVQKGQIIIDSLLAPDTITQLQKYENGVIVQGIDTQEVFETSTDLAAEICTRGIGIKTREEEMITALITRSALIYRWNQLGIEPKHQERMEHLYLKINAIYQKKLKIKIK